MRNQAGMNEKERTRRLTVMGLLCAVAYVVGAVCRIPIVEFLKYEPKDVVIVIGGFLYGPLAAFAISAVVSLVEMITISSTGWYGLLMNILSSCAFAGAAAFIYQRRHTLKGAICGLLAGTALMTLLMLLWNYIITPAYMGVPREAVVRMLPTKSVQDLELKTLKKKFKDKKFAAGCSREVMLRGAEMLGWTPDELLTRTLQVMQACDAAGEL